MQHQPADVMPNTHIAKDYAQGMTWHDYLQSIIMSLVGKSWSNAALYGNLMSPLTLFLPSSSKYMY